MTENTHKSVPVIDRRVCVAPMMEWTDRHCRYLHRLYAPHALLYTEMIVSAAIVRGKAQRLLEHDPEEHPVALQLGGCDPEELARGGAHRRRGGLRRDQPERGLSQRSREKRLVRRLPHVEPGAGRRVRAAHARCGVRAGHGQVPDRRRRSRRLRVLLRVCRCGRRRGGGGAHRARACRHTRRSDAQGKPRDSAAQI